MAPISLSVKVSLSHVWLSAIPWTVAYQAPPSSRPLSNKKTGVGSHSLPQQIFPPQGGNLGLPHRRQILYHLNHQGRCLSQSEVQNFAIISKAWTMHLTSLIFLTSFFPGLNPALGRNTTIIWKWYANIASFGRSILLSLFQKYNLKYFLRDLGRLWNVFQQHREMLVLKQSNYFHLIKDGILI